MDKIKLKNVRLSFPSIFKKAIFQEIEGKYEATFLISKKDKETLELVNKKISSILKQSKLKISPEKICLKDGDLSQYDGYQNCFSLKSASPKKPLVINKDKSLITEESGIIYAGCYVNAIIDFWLQNNKYGKRINSNLYGIQFLSEGEAFCKTENILEDDFDFVENKKEDKDCLIYSNLSFS